MGKLQLKLKVLQQKLIIPCTCSCYKCTIITDDDIWGIFFVFVKYQQDKQVCDVVSLLNTMFSVQFFRELVPPRYIIYSSCNQYQKCSECVDCIIGTAEVLCFQQLFIFRTVVLLLSLIHAHCLPHFALSFLIAGLCADI